MTPTVEDLARLPGVTTAADLRRLARRTDPQTCIEAVRRLEASGVLLKRRWRLLLAVFDSPGHTAGELAEMTGIDRVETGRRPPDLMGYGLIVQGQARRCRVKRTRMVTWHPATEPEEIQRRLW